MEARLIGRLPTALSPSLVTADSQTRQVSPSEPVRRAVPAIIRLHRADHTLRLVGMPVTISAASRLTVNSSDTDAAARGGCFVRHAAEPALNVRSGLVGVGPEFVTVFGWRKPHVLDVLWLKQSGL